LKEKIKEDKESKNIDRGQINRRKKKTMDNLDHLAKKKEGQVGEALKTWVMWTCGPRVLDLGF
jgi:hypothetical protein